MTDPSYELIERLAALASTLYSPPYRSDEQREAFAAAAAALARGVLTDTPSVEIVRRATALARAHLQSQADADTRVEGYLAVLRDIEALAEADPSS